MRALLNAVRTGLTEIWAHKLRSLLSFLAIAAGSVVFIESSASIFTTFERMESQKAVSGMARLRIIQNFSRTYASPDQYVPPPVIAYEDIVYLREKMPELFMLSPEGRDSDTVEYAGRRMRSWLHGVTPEWTKRDFIYTLKGRFINQHDLDNKLRVCVVVRKAPPRDTGKLSKASQKRFDYTKDFDTLVTHSDLLGKMIKIAGLTFTVIGVLEELPYSKRPTLLVNTGGNYRILAPLTTMYHYEFIHPSQSLDVNIDTGDEATFDETLRRVNNFLKIRFGDEEFFVVENQLEEIRERIETSLKGSLMTVSLGLLAFIAGGIGIMNVTLATVFARTREIGVRRAVGATRGDIMLQFIVEAVMLGLLGGLLGSALGYFWGVPAKIMLGMNPSNIQAWMPVFSVLMAGFTAFLFAIYPAWVAAGMKPADALRAE